MRSRSTPLTASSAPAARSSPPLVTATWEKALTVTQASCAAHSWRVVSAGGLGRRALEVRGVSRCNWVVRGLLARVRGQTGSRVLVGPDGVAHASDAFAGAGTSAAFLSYAREDGEFVRALESALRARGKGVWVDWNDIPPSADWRA